MIRGLDVDFIIMDDCDYLGWADEDLFPDEEEFNTETPDDMYGKYRKDISHLATLDVYRVLDLFGVTDHALGHAIKKLLLAGVRTGNKTMFEDIMEAHDTLVRWMQMREEDLCTVNATTVDGATTREQKRPIQEQGLAQTLNSATEELVSTGRTTTYLQ